MLPLISGDAERTCPQAAFTKEFYVTAWQASQIKGLAYNSRFNITDPNAGGVFRNT